MCIAPSTEAELDTEGMQPSFAKRANIFVVHISSITAYSASYLFLSKVYTRCSICTLSNAGRVSSYPHTRQPWVGTNSACCLVLGLRPVGCLHIRVLKVDNFCHNHEQHSTFRSVAGEKGRPKIPQESRVNGWDASAWEGRQKYRMTVAYDGTKLAGIEFPAACAHCSKEESSSAF